MTCIHRDRARSAVSERSGLETNRTVTTGGASPGRCQRTGLKSDAPDPEQLRWSLAGPRHLGCEILEEGSPADEQKLAAQP